MCLALALFPFALLLTWIGGLQLSATAFLASTIHLNPPDRSTRPEVSLRAFRPEASLAAILAPTLPVALVVWSAVLGLQALSVSDGGDALLESAWLRWPRALVWLLWTLPGWSAVGRSRPLIAGRLAGTALLMAPAVARDGAGAVELVSFLVAVSVASEGWFVGLYRRAARVHLDWDPGGVRLYTDHGWRRLDDLPTAEGIGPEAITIGPWSIPYADERPTLPIAPTDGPPPPRPVLDELALHRRGYRLAAGFGAVGPVAVLVLPAWLSVSLGAPDDASALLWFLPGVLAWHGAGFLFPGGMLAPARRGDG
ncbi:MAG: hypothetical protein ABMB14_27715 [Myxococcota bacterium]